ncbi:zinc finger protein, partial [Wuchereria bancrofti]
FCARCGHNLLLPPEFTAAQRTAAVELHALDWCPRACAAVMDERQVKRRRLNLVGREEDAQYLFVPVTHATMAVAVPEVFHPADLGDLPDQFRKELEVPQVEPYTVARAEGNIAIVCGICDRQFETLKGWRIHASRKHKQDGFCARCGHNLLLPPEFTAAQRTAAVELHALDWCPRACAAVMDERQVKRRRLNLVGREEDAQYLFVPGEKIHRVKSANSALPCGQPVVAYSSAPPSIQ